MLVTVLVLMPRTFLVNGTLGLEMDPSENESASEDDEAESSTSEDESEDGLESEPENEPEGESHSKTLKRAKATMKKKARKALKATLAEYEITKVYRLSVPVGKETVEAVLKALVYRWEIQTQDEQNPNRFPTLRRSVLVTSTKEAYYRRLVEDTVTPWPDRGVYCAQRDGYSIEDFLRMMVTLWKGFDTWDRRASLIRDRMAINLRHQAFFRDESLRIMALSDCFRETLHTTFAGEKIF